MNARQSSEITPPVDEAGRPLGRYTHDNGGTVDTRFGFIGDMHSGTLTCNWPGCGAEVFTYSHEADEAADAHWATHGDPS